MAVVGRAEVLVVPSFRGAQKAIKSEMTGAGQSGGKAAAAGIGSSIGKWGKRAVKTTAIGVGAVLGTALVKGFGRLSAIEQAQAKLTGLGHSAKSVDKIMGSALKSVKGTAFGLDEAATVAASTVAAGIKPGKELTKTLTLVGDAATIGGTSMQEMGAIFNKVATSNKVQGDVINQLNDKGIPIVQLLGKTMGKTSDEVMKMSRKGTIGFADFQKAMEAGVGGAAQESGKTFKGAFANMGAALGRFGASLLSGVFPIAKKVMGGITGLLDRMTAAVGPLAERFGKFLSGTLIPGLTGLWDLLVKGDFTKSFGKAFGFAEDSKVVDFLFNLRDAAISLGKFVSGTLVPTMLSLYKWLGGKLLAGGKAAASLFTGTILPALKRFSGFILSTVVPAVVSFAQALAAKVGPVVQRVAGFLAANFVPAVRAVASFVTGSLVPALIVAGRFIASNLKPILQELWSQFKVNILPALRSLAGVIVSRVLPTLGKVVKFVAPIIVVIAALALKILRYVIPVLLRLIGPILGVLIRVLGTVLTVTSRVITGMIDAFKALGRSGQWLWRNVLSPTFTHIKTGIGAVKTAVVTAKDGIGTAFRAIRTAISAVWNGGGASISWVFGKIKAGVGKVADAFGSAKRAVSRVWSGLKDAITGPITTALNWIKDHFVTPIANLLDKVGLDGLAKKLRGFSTGGTVAGYSVKGLTHLAVGGQVPGWSPNDRADNIPAMLTANEYVLPVAAHKRLRSQVGAGGMESLRRGMLPGYAGGGNVWDKIIGLGNMVRGTATVKERADVGISAAEAADRIKGLGANALKSLPGGMWAQAAGSVAKKVLSSLVSKVKDALFGGGAAGGSPMHGNWSQLWSMVQRLDPGARLFSSVRPGARTATGFQSLHSLGKAIDVSPDFSLWQKLWPMRNKFRELYGPWGGWLLGKDRHAYPGAALTLGNHKDHIHIGSYANGGAVKPLLFDRGGYLPQGDSWVRNNTGKPEPLARVDGGSMLPKKVQLVVDGHEFTAYVRSQANGVVASAGRSADYAY